MPTLEEGDGLKAEGRKCSESPKDSGDDEHSKKWRGAIAESCSGHCADEDAADEINEEGGDGKFG